MKKTIITAYTIAILFLLSGFVFGQDTQTGGTSGTDDVVELDVTEIKIKIETPQVRLFSDRIKPEFDDVHLQKSFMKEITGEGERFVFESISNKEGIRIDIDKMVNKVR